jgi:F0F1-type ATP synthase membrane subunit b/b'
VRSNDQSGIAQALEDIEALKKELHDQRSEFEAQIKLLKVCQENIVKVLKDTASKAELRRRQRDSKDL